MAVHRTRRPAAGRWPYSSSPSPPSSHQHRPIASARRQTTCWPRCDQVLKAAICPAGSERRVRGLPFALLLTLTLAHRPTGCGRQRAFNSRGSFRLRLRRLLAHATSTDVLGRPNAQARVRSLVASSARVTPKGMQWSKIVRSMRVLEDAARLLAQRHWPARPSKNRCQRTPGCAGSRAESPQGGVRLDHRRSVSVDVNHRRRSATTSFAPRLARVFGLTLT